MKKLTSYNGIPDYSQSDWKELFSLLPDLNAQPDGRLESFYQEEDPSISWTGTSDGPLSDITTDLILDEDGNEIATSYESEKLEMRVGDLWYCSSDGSEWRWTGREWERTEPPIVAWDVAEGKKTIFGEQPEPPYNQDDIWIDGDDIYLCQVEKESGGVFEYSDWKRVRYQAESVNSLIVEALSPFGLPIADRLYLGEKDEYFVYVLTNDQVADSGDDTAQAYVAYIQVHYICPLSKSYANMRRQIRRALVDSGFSPPEIFDVSDLTAEAEAERVRHLVFETDIENDFDMEV